MFTRAALVFTIFLSTMSDLPTPDYAEEINSEYAQLRAAVEATVASAVRLGHMLIAQKKRTKHGEFMAWVKDHCAFSHESANIYMRIAADPNSQHATNLSLREFLEKPKLLLADGVPPKVQMQIKPSEKRTPPDQRPPMLMSDPMEEEMDDDATATDEQRWQFSAASFLGDVLARRAYWDRQFGRDWEKFERPTSLMTLGKEAVAEFAKLVDAIGVKGSGVFGSPEVNTP